MKKSLFLIFTLSCSLWAQSRVEFVCAGNTSPLQVTFGTATTAGEVVGVGAAVCCNGTADGGVTDNKSGGSSTYTSLTSATNLASHDAVNFYHSDNVASGITVITLAVGTGNATGQSSMCAFHYSSVGAAPIDVVQGFVTGQNTPWSSTATGTLSQTNEVVVGMVMDYSNSTPTFTASAPFTQRGYASDNGGAVLAMSDDIVTSTSSVTYSGTTSLAGGTNAVAVISIKASGGAPAPTGFNKKQKLDKVDPGL